MVVVAVVVVAVVVVVVDVVVVVAFHLYLPPGRAPGDVCATKSECGA